MLRILLLSFVFCGQIAQGQMRLETSVGPLVVSPVVTGLDEPWAVGFLPGGGLLITERDGRLLHGTDGKLHEVSGVPKVRASGQGGLLDVVVARDFTTTQEIFLTYSEPGKGGAGTALAVARFDAFDNSLSNLRVLFRQKVKTRGGRHFGSRIVEARDGTLFVTVGERGDPELAQSLARHNGKIIRINRDGSIPPDNPFASGGALPEIWSFGHRNPQGAALDLQGRLWSVEHGARGGDEINRSQLGKNYGWPIISYGVHYSGRKIGEGSSKPGMEQPDFYWDPSIAPSGMMIYSGKLWPEWKGDIFVGSLKFDMISRLENNGGLREVERLFSDEFIRIRDVREGPEGAIWFIAVGDGTLFRAVPG